MMDTLVTLSPDQIDTSGRIRQADPVQVKKIADSMEQVGLLNPITVMRIGERRYKLIAGLHRLEACRARSVDVLACVVEELSAAEMVLAECDENLCGTRLSPVEESEFLAKRLEAYKAIHGPAKAIGARAANAAMGHDANDKLADASPSTSFVADTAAKMGQSERTVQRKTERGEKVIPEVLSLIRGTALNTGAYLDKLKSLPPNEQLHAAKRDLALRNNQAAAPAADEYDPMAVRAIHKEAEPPKLPSYEDMRAAILLLCDLQPADFITICPPNKRPAMCQKLAHLSETFDKVREAAGV